MKVLYIGHYGDATGWGNAATNNILALLKSGVSVVPRAITYEKDHCGYSNLIKEAEKQSNNDCDIVIQHTLPSNYCYDANYKNIGYLSVESGDFKTTGWQANCNLMDEIWTSSKTTVETIKNSGVTKPIKIVPHSIDIKKYENPSGKQKIDTLHNNFTFGFVGEFIERKNIKALVRAFHMAFDPIEPVNLFIKTSKTDLESVEKYCKFIRDGLKIRSKYRQEVVVTGTMDKVDYVSVLDQVDCFVMPSRGEAFCIPALEAMALGIPSIWTEGIGMEHVLGEPVKSYDVPCFGAVDTLRDLDTSRSTWKEIDVLELAKTMRKMYESLSDDDYKKDCQEQCILRSSAYSHEAVGKKMKELLNAC